MLKTKKYSPYWWEKKKSITLVKQKKTTIIKNRDSHRRLCRHVECECLSLSICGKIFKWCIKIRLSCASNTKNHFISMDNSHVNGRHRFCTRNNRIDICCLYVLMVCHVIYIHTIWPPSRSYQSDEIKRNICIGTFKYNIIMTIIIFICYSDIRQQKNQKK